jgi:hypothetical protein
LKSRKYDPIFKTDKYEDEGSSDHGYDYLLSMPIWNLTMEKVEALLKEKLEKETQVKILIDQTALDLWKTDLDVFLAKWEEFEIMINQLEDESANKLKMAKKPKTAIGQMIKKPKRKVNSDDTMDEEDDYAAKKVNKVAPKKVKEEVAKKAPFKVEVKVEPPKKVVQRKKKNDSDEESEASMSDSDSDDAPVRPAPKKVAAPKVKAEPAANKVTKKKAGSDIESDAVMGFNDSEDEPVALRAKPTRENANKQRKIVDSEDSDEIMSDASSVKPAPKPVVKKAQKQTTLNFAKSNVD